MWPEGWELSMMGTPYPLLSSPDWAVPSTRNWSKGTCTRKSLLPVTQRTTSATPSRMASSTLKIPSIT